MNEDHFSLLFDNPETRIALAYSGGKDSSVLLDLCAPYKDRVTVVWIDTGFAFPHIRRHVASTVQGFSFQEIAHDLKPHWERDGIPTHIVPVDHTPLVTTDAKKPYLQSFISCCQRRIESVVAELAPQGFDVLLLGYRASDAPGGLALNPQDTLGGMILFAPLWEWTDEEIMNYLDRREIRLPMFASADDTSMECWHCPASIDRARVEFVKEHYPEYLPTIRENARPVMEAIASRLDEMAASLE